MKRILITGAAGTIGRALVQHLKSSYELLAVDQGFEGVEAGLYQGIETRALDLDEENSWNGLLDGIDVVIHLAGEPSPEATFEALIQPNYYIPYYLFEAATQAKSLQRIIYASSIHSTGNYPVDMQIKVGDEPRPTSYYGISKLFMEHLANYYAHNHQVESIGIRIGNYIAENESVEFTGQVAQLAEILHYQDFNHLIDCCLEADLLQPTIVINGVSNHAMPRLDLESARQLVGYQPTYDAFEAYLNTKKSK